MNNYLNFLKTSQKYALLACLIGALSFGYFFFHTVLFLLSKKHKCLIWKNKKIFHVFLIHFVISFVLYLSVFFVLDKFLNSKRIILYIFIVCFIVQNGSMYILLKLFKINKKCYALSLVVTFLLNVSFTGFLGVVQKRARNYWIVFSEESKKMQAKAPTVIGTANQVLAERAAHGAAYTPGLGQYQKATNEFYKSANKLDQARRII